MAGYKDIKPRYKKGQSGNPKGRPPVLPELKIAIAKILSKENAGLTVLDEILTALVNRAKKGDVRAAQELLDRGFGKSKQKFEQLLTLKEQPLFAYDEDSE